MQQINMLGLYSETGINYNPLIPKYINKAQEMKRLKLLFIKIKGGTKKIVDKTDITIAGRIMQLANCGVEVTVKGEIIKYLT